MPATNWSCSLASKHLSDQKRYSLMKHALAVFLLAVAGLVHAAPERIDSVALPGPVRWDYVSVDPQGQRVYVAHSDRVEVIDARTNRPVFRLAPTPGVHGAVAAPEVHRIFTSNGAADEVGVFDTRTGRLIRTVKVGQHPDAIAYDAATGRVFAFNGRSNDVTVIDAKTLQVLAASIPAGGSPEYAVSNGKGTVYFNVEDKSELAVLDAHSLTVLRRYSLAPCEEPSGLAMDPKERLYSVCRNKLMVISDPSTGRVLGHAEIGAGADGAAWMDGRAFSANGRDGTISVVSESTAGQFRNVQTIQTERGARTLAADPVLHELFTATADFRPDVPQTGQAPHRPEAIPGSFRVLIVRPAKVR
jgi:YVTN family beta-propeller protein